MVLARRVLSRAFMDPVRHILVATDFGPASDRALGIAIELAQRFDARLTVLHVLEPPAYPYGGMHLPFPIEVLSSRRRAMVQRLESTMQEARKERPDAQEALRDGTPWRTILGTAKELRADLIVVGSHGHRGLPYRLLGSVAEQVVRASPIAVLTVHGFWFEDRQQAGRELAMALEPLRTRAPSVVAVSRGGIVVGTEVARHLGATFDMLLTDRVESKGSILGAVCEGGLTHFAPGAVRGAVAAEKQRRLLSDARERLEEDAGSIRGNNVLGDLWRRTIIVVSDVFVDPWRPLAAADVLAKLGPERIVFAAPVASDEALTELQLRLQDVIVLHPLHAHAGASAAYRDFRSPPTRLLAQCLRVNDMLVGVPPA